MGGIVSEKCNDLSKQIWDLCIMENIWISAVHIPGKQNTIADFMSGFLNENTQWQLSPSILNKIVRTFDFEPEIDLFASYLNFQVENYISWFPDPKAIIIDEFSIDWTDKMFYVFPPFSLNDATLARIGDNEASGIMILPWWQTQFWFLLMLQDFPLQLPSNLKLLILPSNKQVAHPLLPKMRLLAVRLSGKQSKVVETYHTVEI